MSDKIRFFVNDEQSVDLNTRKILERMADTEGVVNPIVTLPDLHYKYSYHTPTGVIVLTEDRIIPKFVNANCGMSFIKTPFFEKDIDERRIDTVFDNLRRNIAVTTRLAPAISAGDLESIVKNGASWAMERCGLNPDDLMNFENKGSIFIENEKFSKPAMSFIPQVSRDVGLLSIGVLGYGNHFIEMQTVDKVLDTDIADKFGLSKGQVVFMIHSDSRAFGQSLLDHYSMKSKKLFGLQRFYKRIHYSVLSSQSAPLSVKRFFNSLNFYLNRAKSTVYWKADNFNRKSNVSFESIDADTEEGEAYLASTYAAINYGYVNRAYLAAAIRDGLKEAFMKDSVEVNILHDGNHDALQKEKIDGKYYYAHRNGAARAMPPAYYPDHPVFSRTGQPVLLPSSLGRHSFLCAASKGCKDSYYSSCHGAGRLIDRGEAREKFTSSDVFWEIKTSGMRVYDYGSGKIQEEAPRAFKNISEVLKSVTDNNIALPVAELRPLAALKGWR